MTTWGLYHGKDLRRIGVELRRMDDREILKRFRRELRVAAAPMVPAVRASIRNIPSTRPYSRSGLRGRLSRATKLRMRTGGRLAGIQILVDPKAMPDHQKSLPQMVEGVKKPWRHPVFGTAEDEAASVSAGTGHGRGWVWVTQPAQPYFFKVVRKLGPASRVAVNRVVNGITKDIT